jgi:hypothetical protein
MVSRPEAQQADTMKTLQPAMPYELERTQLGADSSISVRSV